MAHTVVDHWEPGNGVQELRGRPGRRKVNQGEDNELLGDLKTPYEFNSLSKEREREGERVCFYISSLFSKHEDDRSEGAGREVVCPQWENKVVDLV